MKEIRLLGRPQAELTFVGDIGCSLIYCGVWKDLKGNTYYEYDDNYWTMAVPESPPEIVIVDPLTFDEEEG